MKPFFSIVIPLYNKENFIVKTINSALNQTYKDFEIIVINDGSTDNSLNKLQELNDSRIFVYTIKNKGVSAARNYGIEKANADQVCFLDADDYWYPNHLETLYNLISNYPECGLYATGYEKKHFNKTLKSIYKNVPNKLWQGIIKDYFDSSLINSIAWTSTACVPKKILQSVGMFDTQITLGAGEDTDLWIRLALNYQVAFDNSVTGIHNLHAENRVSNANTNLRRFLNLDKYETHTKHYKSLKKYLDLNRFSIAIQYKLAGNKSECKKYSDKIDFKNLNLKQKILLKSPIFIARALKNLQLLLRQLNINLSAFK